MTKIITKAHGIGSGQLCYIVILGFNALVGRFTFAIGEVPLKIEQVFIQIFNLYMIDI